MEGDMSISYIVSSTLKVWKSLPTILMIISWGKYGLHFTGEETDLEK